MDEEVEVGEIDRSGLNEYIELREASEKDFPQYVGANVEAELAAGCDGFSKLFDSYPIQGHKTFGVFERNKLVGVAALTRKHSEKYKHKAFPWGMYIYPDYRKKGVSKLLMDYCIAWAKGQQGLESIILFVTATNAAGMNFYQRFGFQCYGTEKRHMFAAGQFHDAHLYELVL